MGWQIPLVHKSPPHFCFESGSTCDFEASDRSCIPRKMRDLLSLIFSVLGFSGLGFWFRAKLFLGAERFVDLSTSVLRFEKFAQKCFCFAAAILRAFFLHALSACMLLHGCRSESHLLPPRIKPCGEMLLAFDFPPDPPLYALASGFLAVPAFLFDTANLSICIAFPSVSLLQVCIGSLFHQPVVWAVALLLHFACSAAPAVRCTPCQKRLQHHNPSFSVLRTFCLTVAVVRRRLGRASSSLSVVCRRLF